MTTITTHTDPEGHLRIMVQAPPAVDRATATAFAYIAANRIRAINGKGETGKLQIVGEVKVEADLTEYYFVDRS